jgi:hypothetical protein
VGDLTTNWRAALAMAVIVFAPPALAAQKWTDPTMPLPPGVIRERELETPAAPADTTGTRMLEIYRVGAPIEMVFAWYQRRFMPTEDLAPDTAAMEPGEVTQIGYHVTYHKFADECADARSGASTSTDSTAACKRWRHGADKRRALGNSRVALSTGDWIERVTLTWFSRAQNGDLVRRRIDVLDAGLSSNWQRDELRTQITLERGVVQAAAQ